ncbi:mortality factor 4-like protein 1 [Diaphorina citri]|uniref:Mortality factor 4-like protein 1 n=1 Tax=Diaphorina citri TaxID=121845 RepID=A0A3Q0IZV7_DIACI|nr:mortality factor 4-like protein 1 [Diaphorina citri]
MLSRISYGISSKSLGTCSTLLVENLDKRSEKLEVYLLQQATTLNHCSHYMDIPSDLIQRWDEWVPECRVLKFNESNVQRQKDLKKSQQESDQSSKKKKKFDGKDSEGRCVTPTLDKICSRWLKQPHDQWPPKLSTYMIDTIMEEYLNKVEIKIKIPDSLRTWLVDDWDTINNKNKLHQIPAKTSVDEIFESYLKHKANSKQMSGAKGKTVTEMVAGLKEYFNVMLGSQLLYQAERRQYSQVMQKYQGAPLSSLYGASHLLRLFVRIGSVLAYTGLTERNIQLLQNAFQDFLW